MLLSTSFEQNLERRSARRIVPVGSLAALIAFQLRPYLNVSALSAGILHADHLERHLHCALAALAAYLGITLGLSCETVRLLGMPDRSPTETC